MQLTLSWTFRHEREEAIPVSKELVRRAMLDHTVTREALADAIIRTTTKMFIEAAADYLRRNGYGDAAYFLDKDTEATLTGIDAMAPKYLEGNGQ